MNRATAFAVVTAVLLSGTAFAAEPITSASLATVKCFKTEDRSVAGLKVVSGVFTDTRSGQTKLAGISVWVNGFTTKVGMDGTFRILIASEEIRSVYIQLPDASFFLVKMEVPAQAQNFDKLYRIGEEGKDAAKATAGEQEGDIRDLLRQPGKK